VTRSAPPGRAVLVGATGYTGRLVARELASADLPFVLAARRPGPLEEVAREVGGAPTRTVDVTEPGALASALEPGDVLVNTVGPFVELGEPVVRASVGAGAHYLDTTGEQTFMKRTADRWHAPARQAGVAVVNGMAFEYALGDAAAALASRGLGRPLDRVDVVYGWRAGAASTSAGTRASMVRILGRRGWALEDGGWRREPVARRRRRVRLPGGAELEAMSFPAGEVVTVPRHLEVGTVRGWIVAGRWTVRIARLLSPALPVAARLAEPLLDRLARRGPEGPTREQRRSGRFDVVATAVGPEGGRRSVAVSGRDPYGLTAAVIVRGARALLARADGPEGGVLPPSRVVEPDDLLGGLGRFDVEWGEAPEAGPAG
jgi:short subunit dehydrogenase-like uncharacterized protein